jgi:hypothetical protein
MVQRRTSRNQKNAVKVNNKEYLGWEVRTSSSKSEP